VGMVDEAAFFVPSSFPLIRFWPTSRACTKPQHTPSTHVQACTSLSKHTFLLLCSLAHCSQSLDVKRSTSEVMNPLWVFVPLVLV